MLPIPGLAQFPRQSPTAGFRIRGDQLSDRFDVREVEDPSAIFPLAGHLDSCSLPEMAAERKLFLASAGVSTEIECGLMCGVGGCMFMTDAACQRCPEGRAPEPLTDPASASRSSFRRGRAIGARLLHLIKRIAGSALRRHWIKVEPRLSFAFGESCHPCRRTSYSTNWTRS